MKVGLALGGGGVRGLAHVPALETLDACGIRPAAIAGTSMGAIIGALYASGLSGKEIREVIERHSISKGDGVRAIYAKKRNLLKWLGAVRIAWGKPALLRADGFLRYLLAEVRAETFEDLEIPLQIVATDYERGEAVVFSEGELLTPLAATMAVPGIFAPVEQDERLLVDGGCVHNLPFDLLPDDCDVTIAVDVAHTRAAVREKAPGILDATIGMYDILMDRVTSLLMKVNPPTIYIRPTLTGIRVLDFDKFEEVYEQASPAMGELEERLRDLGEESGFSKPLKSRGLESPRS